MIIVVNKNNNYEEYNKENTFYIGRGSVFGNYIYTNKSSQYDLPNMSNIEGLPLVKKDFDSKYEKSKEFKFFVNKILNKIKNGEDVVFECYCTNKNIQSVKDIKIEKAKCHGEILALKVFEIMENELKQKPSISNDMTM